MKNSKLILLYIIALFISSCSDANENIPLPDWWLGKTDMEEEISHLLPTDNFVCAHRGGSKEGGDPDNSKAALNRIINLKCYASECDIHITKDNKVVVFHDNTFNGIIFKDATYEELKQSGKLSNGEELPLLEEFIDIIKAGKTTQLWIDVKSLDAPYGDNSVSIKAGKAAAEIVRIKKAYEFVGFLCGRKEVYDSISSTIGYKCMVAYMSTDWTASAFISSNIKWGNFDINKFGTKDDKIQSFLSRNIRLSLYPINSDEQINWYLPYKQNVIAVTDYPAKMLDKLGIVR